MSAIEDFFVLDSENSLVGDKHKLKKIAKGSFGVAARKKLGDLSNLPQQPKSLIQLEKEQFVPNTTKEYIDRLQKENMTLMRLLLDRNKIIELTGIELQKLRVNLEKFQQQNLQLAQANSQMLVELNSGKDRLKALNHELGCKNGLLKAKKMELEDKAKIRKCPKMINQVGTSKPEEARETSEAGGTESNPGSINRKRQSKSLGPSIIKQVQLKEKIENKRVCLGRQSARFKSEEPAPTEDTLEIVNTQFPVGSLNDNQMREDNSKEKIQNKRFTRVGLRRQSAMVKSEEPALTEDIFEMEARETSGVGRAEYKPGSTNRKQQSKSLGPSTIEQVHLKETIENKRVHLRRQSARFESEEPAPTEDTFEMDNAQSSVCSLNDDSTSMSSSVKKDDGEGASIGPSELRRSSIGRPLRSAATKVHSYKETALNVKMRRPE
ncbi:hypothetical protein U1Q18_021939 [Sarracenia purpurea var. burkii]